MTSWGVAPARGQLLFCRDCGAIIIFREERRPAAAAQEEADRVTLAVEKHHLASRRCRSAETFEGREIVACRCPAPMRIPRQDGLFCARCEGVMGPTVAASGTRRSRQAKRQGGSR